jgi:hypothetical protein
MWAMKTTRVATFRIDYQRVELGPPYPNAVFHVKPRRVVHGWPENYPNVIREVQWVSSNSATVNAIKFVGPHKSRMHWCTTQCLLQRGPTDTVLNRHRRGLPPLKLRIWKHATLNLPVRYSPLSPSCPAWSHIKLTNPIANINHIEPPSWEGALLWAVINHSSSTENLFY